MSFYQSDLRRYINQYIYKKPIFDIEIMGKKYFGIMKHQRKLGKEFRRYMVHGISGLYIPEKQQSVIDALTTIKRDFGKSRSDILFQLGSIDIFDQHTTKELKKKEAIQELKLSKQKIHGELLERYGLLPTWREHMPEATVVLDLTLNAEETKQQMSSSGKRYLKKSQKAGLEFLLAEEKDWELFRRMRYRTAYDKGFHIIDMKTFMDLISYLIETKQGNLFLMKQGSDIVSGSIILYHGDDLVYLYGATDRNFGDIGGHYGLMYEICKRGHRHKKSSLDLLGIAPVGFQGLHALGGVSRFKQAFGGTTVSYVGNMDLIFNGMLYKGLKMLKGK